MGRELERNTRTAMVIAILIASAMGLGCIGLGVSIGRTLSTPGPAELARLPPLRAGMWVMCDVPGRGVLRAQIAEVSGGWIRISEDSEEWVVVDRVLEVVVAPQRPIRPDRPSGSQTGSRPDVGSLEN